MDQTVHLSMRVPWRDRAWDGHVCDRPLDNSSCILLSNIGDRRDDDYEQANAGLPVLDLDLNRLPCISERATFMSPTGYTLTKTHPYAKNKALKGTLLPSPVVIPGHAFEAVPFRWLGRATFEDDVLPGWETDYDSAAEDRVREILGFDPSWIMDGSNQRAVIDTFFEPVVPHVSLVFAYVKHSPFQDADRRRLLVGAALVTDIVTPPMWKTDGSPPFDSCMWETAVSHSLRPDMKNGVLLPYQKLAGLEERGVDIAGALAWQPEGRDVEFSYVTEHVSDDAAIEALSSLASAARGMAGLGIEMPASAAAWIDDQIGRIWKQRGPTPGLGSVLAHLDVRGAHGVARRVMAEITESEDPWDYLESGFVDPSIFTVDLRRALGASTARIWSKQSVSDRSVLKLLSAMDIATDQIELLLSGYTPLSLNPDELLDNPYWASICTYTDPSHIPFTTVDRACFPPPHVPWASPLPSTALMTDHRDDRRIEALLVDSLERAALDGNTVVPQAEALAYAATVPITSPVLLNDTVLMGLALDAASFPVDYDEEWSPIMQATVADGVPAYKLLRLATVADVIRDNLLLRMSASRASGSIEARRAIDAAVGEKSDESVEEEAARAEKAAGLEELHASALSVLIGPAGTGKTTLLKALVGLPAVKSSGDAFLLAPTGKARVQLQQKVGLPARTLASLLSGTGRYDGSSGVYSVVDGADRFKAGLVVIDEASMLTEEMLAATLDAFSSIKRLVLVGDPRQLPPIGAGRPFVDIVEELRPSAFDSSVRVGRGYIELQVTRRQKNAVGADLALAKWFGGGELGPDDDKIWTDLATDPDQERVRYVSWSGASPTEIVKTVLSQELPFDRHLDVEKAFALTYGGSWNDPWMNWERGAGERAENWQILTPTRSKHFGSVELNRHIKRIFRSSDTTFASSRARYIPRPIGPESIVRGDKVMQTRNAKMRGYPKENSMNYVANGEIGVVIGRTMKNNKAPANVEFSSQPGFTYSYWSSAAEDPPLELAWAITVHKSQGSEFRTTFVMIPSRVRVSRELLYTALTRHVERVVVLHDGTLSELRQLARPSASETAARLTDLFRPPTPAEVSIAGTRHRVDANLVHVTGTGVLVRSKNEVILADILHSVAPGQWKYEELFTGSDGTYRSPDFTIETILGDVVLWEHLGMLDRADYAAKWEAKKKWYSDNGVLPWTEGGGPNGTLVWTDDRDGVDVPAWRNLAHQVLGSGPKKRPAAAKKAAPRKANG